MLEGEATKILTVSYRQDGAAVCSQQTLLGDRQLGLSVRERKWSSLPTLLHVPDLLHWVWGCVPRIMHCRNQVWLSAAAQGVPECALGTVWWIIHKRAMAEEVWRQNVWLCMCQTLMLPSWLTRNSGKFLWISTRLMQSFTMWNVHGLNETCVHRELIACTCTPPWHCTLTNFNTVSEICWMLLSSL